MGWDKQKGWIGVDLDATLAEYDGVWRGMLHIGAPIEPMVERIVKWVEEGREVRILTARATPQPSVEQGKDAIQAWLKEHVYQRLPDWFWAEGMKFEITNQKDWAMKELWDDRAVRVEPNTGRVI